MKNPVEYFVEGVHEFAEIKDPEIKAALYKLGEIVKSDMIIGDYDPSSDAITAAEEFQLEINEYEARLLAENEEQEEKVIEDETEIPLEIEAELEEEEELLLPEEEVT